MSFFFPPPLLPCCSPFGRSPSFQPTPFRRDPPFLDANWFLVCAQADRYVPFRDRSGLGSSGRWTRCLGHHEDDDPLELTGQGRPRVRSDLDPGANILSLSCSSAHVRRTSGRWLSSSRAGQLMRAGRDDDGRETADRQQHRRAHWTRSRLCPRRLRRPRNRQQHDY